jgi:hypothetical protein
MIACYWKWYIGNNYIAIPHEINNEFLWNARRALENWKIKWIEYIPSFNDFWAPVEYKPEELDKLYKDFEVLESNLDRIIKVVPLPKTIWNFDWYYYPWFIDYTNDRIDREVFWIKKFTKEDMLLIISLIKKKILEAKEKWATLIFSWD